MTSPISSMLATRNRRTSAKLLLLAVVPTVVGIGSNIVACTHSSAARPQGSTETPLPVEPDDEDMIPCAPRAVLQTVCQKCHQNPPLNGAPFPLVTRSNLMRVIPDGEIRVLMIQVIEARRMPLTPEKIDEEDRATLLAWLKAGAPAEGPQTCAPPTEDGDAALESSTTDPDDEDAGATVDGSSSSSDNDAASEVADAAHD